MPYGLTHYMTGNGSLSSFFSLSLYLGPAFICYGDHVHGFYLTFEYFCLRKYSSFQLHIIINHSYVCMSLLSVTFTPHEEPETKNCPESGVLSQNGLPSLHSTSQSQSALFCMCESVSVWLMVLAHLSTYVCVCPSGVCVGMGL